MSPSLRAQLDLWWSATTSRYANSATCSSAFLHGCLKTDRGYDEDTAGHTTNKIHKLLLDSKSA